ncbi:type IV pilus twitching motility protein PilT [Novosphingobium sp. FKTRR1]|uniref:type IV pilus twitching motility protein PilT n=1 Tax=Novosphingobium sp. FKTRR1 TaxID=2879118 RepID=UPI001CF01B03|nr:type IV pilus twitching motility protein PilT [Novosphingobium sp. FKTRR1]
MSDQAEGTEGPQTLPDLREKVAARRGGARKDANNAASSPDPDDMGDKGGGGLGPDCPAVPLGVNGETLYLLDDLCQLRKVAPKLDKSMLYSLFSAGWLDERFPMLNANGEPVRNKFNQDRAQRAVIHACKAKGRISIDDAERQRGSHASRKGALVLHCGDALVIAGEAARSGQPSGQAAVPRPVYTRRPGLYERLIFPLDNEIERPANEAATLAEVWDCLDHINRGGWNWKGPTHVTLGGDPDDPTERVDIYAWLIFGWAMSAKLCGALFRRPALLVTGPTQQGKSTLLARLKDLIGEGWFISPEDPSEAGITAEMGKARIAVLLDELEGKEDDPGYIKRMYNLMLRSFDGGGKLRSSADQKAVKTELYSSFQGSSVLPPKMRPQERNRIIIAEIGVRLDPSRAYECPEWFGAIGPKLHRRLAEQWPRYAATLKAYENEMARRGSSGRERDCYATALACADLALFDREPDAASEAGTSSLTPARVGELVAAIVPLIGTLRTENIDHPERAMAALLSSHLPSTGGMVQQTVGQWIERGIIALGVDDESGWAQARTQLAAHGMRLCNLKPDHAASKAGVIEMTDLGTGYLCIAGPTHEGMAKIYKATEFNQGRWPDALSRLVHVVRDKEGHEAGQMPAIKGKIPKIGGWQGACTLIPLAAFLDLVDLSEQVAIARDAALMGHQAAVAAARARRKDKDK